MLLLTEILSILLLEFLLILELVPNAILEMSWGEVNYVCHEIK